MSAVPETTPTPTPQRRKRERKPITAERFFELRSQEGHELVDGALLRLSDASGLHGKVTARIIARLYSFVCEHDLGAVVCNDTDFVLDDWNVRKPDVAFIPKAQWRGDYNEDRPLPYSPPLAVEIVSKTDLQSRIEKKIREYLDAGSREVWIVRPWSRTVEVWRVGEDPRLLAGQARLESPGLLPGFSVPVSSFFAD